MRQGEVASDERARSFRIGPRLLYTDGSVDEPGPRRVRDGCILLAAAVQTIQRATYTEIDSVSAELTNNSTGFLSELSHTVTFGQGVVRSFSVFTHEQGRRLPGSECADGTGVRNDLIVCRHGRRQFVPKDLPDSARLFSSAFTAHVVCRLASAPTAENST